MWHAATFSFPLPSQNVPLLVCLLIAILQLSHLTPLCQAFRTGFRAGILPLHLCRDSSSPSCRLQSGRVEASHTLGCLHSSPEGSFVIQDKNVKSPFLSELVYRGIISQATDLHKLDEFICSYESGGEGTSDGRLPAIYYGIDLTNNFIHEGTLFQLLVLRRFLAHKFNVVIILGGGTTTVGDPSYKSRRSKVSASSFNTGCHTNSVILDQPCISPSPSPENTSAILDIVTKVLKQPIMLPGGDVVHPSLHFASQLDEADVDKITSSCYNVVCLNNQDLYSKITLSEYLGTVASNMSVGRMLSRDCIKARMSIVEGNTAKLQVNMNLAEFMYMSLQATDFVHVASKFNSIIQLGGRDQMGNIMSGVDLYSSLGEGGKAVFGITTPLLQTPSGEKISKSVGECLLKITSNTKALAFWSHFRSVDDTVVENYLRWLTGVPLSLIKDTLAKHVNDAKILLADELTTAVFGRDYTDVLHKYWLSRDMTTLIQSRENVPIADYESFMKFTECVQSVTLDHAELEKGIDFGTLMDRLRTPQMVSGRFYSNRRAIREGTCRINGSVVNKVNYNVMPGDLLRLSCEDGRVLQYITIQFGKHQLYFAKLNQV